MKSNKFFHAIAIAVTLLVLVPAISAPTALASRELELAPEQGEIDGWVDVDGDGFIPSDFTPGSEDYSYVNIYFSSQEADTHDDIDSEVTIYKHVKSGLLVDEDGKFSTGFEVPAELSDGDEDENVHRGTYYVYVTYIDDDSIISVAEFTVIAAEIVLDPDEGTVGAEIEISGIDFSNREIITIEYDGKDVEIASGDEKTDRDGEFACAIIIPESAFGEHIITVSDESDSAAEASFIVEPEITLATTAGASGRAVTVKGTGFGAKTDITITFDGDKVKEDETDKYGSFEVTFTVPVKKAGIYTVEAKDEDKNRSKADFNIAAGTIKLSQATINIGSEVTISGSGFQPDTHITITYATDPIVVATTITDANGDFSAVFIVPESEHGKHPITVSDGTNTIISTVTMESMPPPVPSLMVPEEEAKAGPMAYFDWDDVTDPSGVTYTLQIATDDNFTNESIVLEKAELTDSEYTLTEEENLEPTDKEAPYYWRVRAVDGAANEGAWASSRSFFAALASTGLSTVTKYTLWVVGILLFGFICFWAGKKSAYH